MSNNTGFMNFPIDTAASFPSRTVAAFSLVKYCATFLGTVVGERPLGVSNCCETCTTTTSDESAILVTASGDLVLAFDWSATTAVNTAFAWIDRTIANGLGSRDGGRQDASWTGWYASGKGYKGGVMLPGTRSTIETLVTRAQFLATRHQYSCEQTRCRIVQGIAPRNDWSEFGISFSEDQICSGQGFDLIIGAIRHRFRSYLEAEPEVQAGIALVPIDEVSKRNFCGIPRESATNFVRWRVVSKSFFRPN